MTSFTQQKVQLRQRILTELNKVGQSDKEKLIAKFSLDTGFVESTIKKILAQMELLEIIRIDGMVVSVNKPVEPKEVTN